ncbi:MAG: FAD-dependent oxidoreductase [Comamonadaceae bacterium]|nr:MAG: FAD-dependent oxidoreductase [Comamonadaceae bacterium]
MLARADLVVIAAAHGSVALSLRIDRADAADGAAAQAPTAVTGVSHAAQQANFQPEPLALQALRGQVTWQWHPADNPPAWPPFPVNGHGSLIPSVPLSGRPAWLAGATYERQEKRALIRPSDQADNLARLGVLLPQLAQNLALGEKPDDLMAWSGVRCATPARLPVVAPLDRHPAGSGLTDEADGSLWVSSGMGSRGLCFAALCAELLAARLHGEPLPIEVRLAAALDRAGAARAPKPRSAA